MIADFRDFLKASNAIANLVEDRFENQYVRQGTKYPHILLTLIDDRPPLYHLGGEPDISDAIIQVDCYAKDANGPNGQVVAGEIADAVRNRASGYRGTMGSISVRSCNLTSSTPLDEEPEAGESGRVHRVSMDFQIKYYRAVPDFT